MLGGITMSIEPLELIRPDGEAHAIAFADEARIERAADRRDGGGA